MKTIKRIITVALLIAAGLIIGYLVYTGSRMVSECGSITAISEGIYEQEQSI